MHSKYLTLPISYAAIALTFGMLAVSSSTWAGGSELRLRAALAGGVADIGGQADFRDRGSRRNFSVEVEGFAPGDMFDVSVAGAIVAKVVVNEFGIGDVNFDSNFEAGIDDPATQFPGNFPMLDGGEKIEIGPLSGTLQAK